MPIPAKRCELQNATSKVSDSAAATIAIAGQAPDSPGTPHTASPSRAKAATVAASKTSPPGRLTASGTSHDSFSVKGVFLGHEIQEADETVGDQQEPDGDADQYCHANSSCTGLESPP